MTSEYANQKKTNQKKNQKNKPKNKKLIMLTNEQRKRTAIARDAHRMIAITCSAKQRVNKCLQRKYRIK